RLRPERRARVVHHHVEAAELLDGTLDDALHLLLDAHVDHLGERAPSHLLDRFDDRLQMLHRARAERHVRAGPRELDRDGLADAGAAAGDNRGLAFEGKGVASHAGHHTANGWRMSSEVTEARSALAGAEAPARCAAR